MIKDFKELLELARSRGTRKMAVAMAADREVLLAVKNATELSIVDPILVGDKKEIDRISKEIGFDLEAIEIVDTDDKVEASRIATEKVSKGQADILMKGLVDTATILKAVLDKEIGLRTGKVLSHAAIFDIESYHKVFFVTDAAMNISPSLEQKKQIIENTVELCHSLDIDNPKLAVLAAKETVSEKMPATVDAAELVKMNKSGEISGCIVEGPYALDNAISKEAAEHKGIEGEVAGDADVLLVPYIEAGNVLYKALTFLGGAKSAGIILGAKAPIVLTSRADNEESKLYSIALSALLASK